MDGSPKHHARPHVVRNSEKVTEACCCDNVCLLCKQTFYTLCPEPTNYLARSSSLVAWTNFDIFGNKTHNVLKIK